MRVRADLEVKEMVLAEATAVNVAKKQLGPYGQAYEDKLMPADQQIDEKLTAVVFDVLQAMGRQADFMPLKDVLEQHMITTQEDLMVLTPEYCDSISLPYGFVQACKQKIRQRKVEGQDKWALNMKEAQDDNFDSVSVATAPLPPQVANDPRKLKEHHRRASERLGGASNTNALHDPPESWHDDMSDGGQTARSVISPRSPRSRAPSYVPRTEQRARAATEDVTYRDARPDRGLSKEELHA